jgi:hypothetical protein
VGDTGTSTPEGKEDPKDKKYLDDSHAVPPPPNNYSHNPYIPTQGPPHALDSSSLQIGKF